MTASLLNLKVIKEPDLYYLVSLVSQLKLLLPVLPVIQNSYPNRIHGFYKKLVISVQTLDTMNKLREINVHVRLTLDKLPGIRADLVRIAEEWREWTFSQL